MPNKKNAPIHVVDGEYITEYLILGPFFPDVLSTDFLADIGGEANIEPKEGDTVATPDGKHLTWQRYESRTDVINLLAAFGLQDYATAYAFCSVRAENASDVAFSLRNEAGIAIWINGKRVYSDSRDLFLDSGLFEARLKSGANRCLVKVTRWAMHWGFALRALPPTRAIISGVVSDEAKQLSPDAEICLEQRGRRLALVKTDSSGKYRLGVYPVSGTYDISAIQDRMGAWQLGIQLSERENRMLNLELREAGSIEGRLLMLDNETGHAAVVVQALHNGKVVATTLSDRYEESGRYEFSNLKPGDYQLRCQVLGGYVYYQKEGKGEARERESGAILHVEAGKTLKNVDFHFAPFKKGMWRNYTCLDGLPHIEVRVIYRDPDGVMWFGTRGGGVSRYDGREFVNFTIRDGLVSNRVRAIYRNPEGIMWFGTENGISRYDGSEFFNFTTADGLVDNRVWDICRDADGVIWFGTHGGVSRYDGESFFNFTTEDGLAGNNVMAVHCDSDGLMWFATHGGVSRYDFDTQSYSTQASATQSKDGEKFINLTFADGFIDHRVNTISRDAEGMMCFGTHDGVSRYDGQEIVNFTSKADGLVGGSVRSVCCDMDGVLWFASLGGILRYDGKRFVNFTTQHGLFGTHEEVCGEVYCDPDGILWAGTYDDGVSRYDRETFISFSEQDGLPGSFVRAIYRDVDGVMWLGTHGGVSRYDGKRFMNLTTEDGLIHPRVNVICPDADGAIWIGTDWGGVSRYDFDTPSAGFDTQATQPKPQSKDGKQFVNFTHRWAGGPLAHPRVNDICCAPDGILWFGTGGFIGDSGLVRYDGKDFIIFTTEHGLPSNEVLAIYGEPDGTVWIGTTGGLSKYDGTQFINFTTEDGLVDDSVSAIYRDADGVMWFGTGDGVSRYDGSEFQNFTMQDGLVPGVIISIHRTSDGILWFASYGGGVSMYDGIAWSSLDTRDGLAGNLVGAIDEEADGSVWLATSGGLVRYRRSSTKPKAYIISVTTDGTYQDLSALPDFIAGQHVTIEYAALDFKTIPAKQQYRCRIREIDKDWRGKPQASVAFCKPTKARLFDYIFDKPGNYTFEVQAIDRDLNYSEPAVLNLTVQADPVLVSMQTELNYLRLELREKYNFENIIGGSARIREMRALMEKAVDSELTVLITGETGTGKELVAKGIHYNSPRKNQPLLDRNCGAIPKELLASELFGHRKGAFTGANEDKMGLFESAQGGTVLLDEIGEMPENAQIHLLRVLQEHKIQRLGEMQLRDVDVRVIAITNRDLAAEVRAGRFREDLYYRLNVFPIHVPALRERVKDIPLLAEHFLQEACRKQNKEIDGFSPEVMDMQSYPWPGNVRELEHAVYRAVALVEEGMTIQAYHFSPKVTNRESLIQQITSEVSSYAEAVDSFRQRFIEQVLSECGGNRHEAARRLRMNRSNLIKLVKRLGIGSDDT